MVSNIETLRLADLRIFQEAARRLSITASGEALNMPKSAVSKSLTRLENQLGVKLLERSSRRVELTAAGQLLQIKAASLLAEAEFLVHSMEDERNETRGVVHLTAPTELGTWFVEQVIPEISRHYPDLKITLKLDYRFDDILDPAFDIALRVGDVHDDRLVASTIGSFSRIAVASPQWLQKNPIRKVADLAHCNSLIFSAHDNQIEWTFVRDGRKEGVRVSSSLSVLSFTALLHAARESLGIACVPEFTAREWLQRGDLVQVLPGWHTSPQAVFLVHRFGHEKIARIKTVLDVVKTHSWLKEGM